MIASALGNTKHTQLINYVNDSSVLGGTFDKRLNSIKNIMNAFSQSSVIAKMEKCQFVNQETEFLG